MAWPPLGLCSAQPVTSTLRVRCSRQPPQDPRCEVSPTSSCSRGCRKKRIGTGTATTMMSGALSKAGVARARSGRWDWGHLDLRQMGSQRAAGEAWYFCREGLSLGCMGSSWQLETLLMESGRRWSLQAGTTSVGTGICPAELEESLARPLYGLDDPLQSGGGGVQGGCAEGRTGGSLELSSLWPGLTVGSRRGTLTSDYRCGC